MKFHYGNVVLVTGASSGIGKSIADQLAQLGFKVYGTSRKAAPERKTEEANAAASNSAGGFVKMLKMDVCSEESVKEAVRKVLEAEGEVGIVINNAGMGIAGSVEDTSPEEAFLQFDTNFFGMHRVVRQVLPSMRKQGRGIIVNISSVAAVFHIPYQSMYVASKAAMEGMSGALRNELRQFGIRVALVEPGDTKTGFTGSRVFAKSYEAGSAYTEYCRKSVAVMEHDEENGMNPSVVTKAVLKVISRKNPPVAVVAGFQYKPLIFLKRLLPQRFVSFLLSKMYGGN